MSMEWTRNHLNLLYKVMRALNLSNASNFISCYLLYLHVYTVRSSMKSKSSYGTHCCDNHILVCIFNPMQCLQLSLKAQWMSPSLRATMLCLFVRPVLFQDQPSTGTITTQSQTPPLVSWIVLIMRLWKRLMVTEF